MVRWGMENISQTVLDRFRRAIQHQTCWIDDGDTDPAGEAEAERRLGEFQNFLVTAYPHFHRVAERYPLSPFGVAYRWPGKGGTTERPILFLSHYDVVPAEREKWTTDPFSAELREGFIYGRGTLDTKNTLISCMEAAEALVSEGFSPASDIWFAFGGDEERSGQRGAKNTAAWFKERGIRFSWALDEGSIVTQGILKGIDKPLALIGVEEKGFLDIQLSVAQAPGHASRPPKEQAVAILAQALVRLAKKPFPYHLTAPVESFFSSLADFYRPPVSWIMKRARALGPLFFTLAATTPETTALLRTTVAMTQLKGSSADNILPSEAQAILNLRLLSPWTVDSAVAYVQGVIHDPRVSVTVSPLRAANDPVDATAAVARGKGSGWREISTAVSAVFPDAAVLPFLVTATTDSRYYAELCDAVYRFGPLVLDAQELARIHGHDERISLENLGAGIRWYTELLGTL